MKKRGLCISVAKTETSGVDAAEEWSIPVNWKEDLAIKAELSRRICVKTIVKKLQGSPACIHNFLCLPLGRYYSIFYGKESVLRRDGRTPCMVGCLILPDLFER